MADDAADDDEYALHTAIREGRDLDAIRWIVENDPQSLRRRCSHRGRLPLHWAINMRSPPGVVRYLLQQFPEAVHEVTDRHGRNLPAHLVCQNRLREGRSGRSDMETARLVINAWPGALRERNGDGHLPLHLAEDFELIRLTLKTWPESIEEAGGLGRTVLHLAVSRGAEFSMVRFFARRCPRLVQARDEFRRIPLHCITDQTELDVVKYLVKQWEESLDILDDRGNLPLHSAVEDDGTSEEIVDFLIAQAPQSVRVRAKDGILLIHLAVLWTAQSSQLEGDENFGNVQRLVDEWPESLLEATEEGLLPLHDAAKMANLPLVRFLAERNPESVHVTTGEGWLALHLVLRLTVEKLVDDDEEGVQTMYETARFLIDQFPLSLLEPTSKEGYLPLHVAAMTGYCHDDFVEDEDEQMEVDFFQDLIRRAPEAVQIASNAGLVPFQYAIQQGQLSMPAVEFLAEQWPDALGQVDGDARTVMHMAVSRTPPRLDLVEFLAEQQPQLLGATDRNGSNPLHVAVAQILSRMSLFESFELLEIVRYLAEQRPESLAEADHRGSLPLHVAAESVDPALDVVRMLVELRPEALGAADSNGSLPVHVALGLGQPCFERVTFLVEQRPESLGVADAQGSIPLHVAAAAGDSISHELVQYLVERSPESVQTRNAMSGMLPLFLAATADAPLDVLFFLATTWPEGVCENRRPRSE